MRSDSQTPVSRRPSRPSSTVHISLLLIIPLARATAMEPRWGHAATFISSPPAILIQGGKTDPSNVYTYTSTPNSADTILIPLDESFDGSTPPALTLNTSSAPAYAFHSITNLGGRAPTWGLLSFGGDGGPSEPTQTQPDSAWLGSINSSNDTVAWTHEESAWGGQPQRRLYHSAAGPGSDGKVYITGGLKGDGSGQTFDDVYAYDSAMKTFTILPSLSAGTYHHTSVLLPNGTLVILGGVSMSPTTGNAATVPLTQAFILDTTASSPIWETRSLSGSQPDGRRGSSLVLSSDGSKAYLFGGADAGLSRVYADGWELDMESALWTQVASSGVAARYDHSAVAVGGDQIVVFGGYGTDGPVDAELHVWNTATGSWSTDFVAVSAPPSASTPKPSSSGAMSSAAPPGAKTSESTPVDGQSQDATNGSASATDQVVDTSAAPTSSSSSSPDQAPPSAFTTPAKIALILGCVAVAATIVAGLIYRHRRRKRRAALLGAAAWNGKGDGGDRPYGSREKGGEGLMDETYGRPAETIDKSPIIGLGMGAIGASLASISSKLGARRQQDPYAALHDEGQIIGGPMRRSTRREGSGIRLVGGPRPSTSTTKYAPIRLGTALVRLRSPLDAVREDRIDMLHDEDSRDFVASQRSADWIMSDSTENGQWTSARSILGHREEASDPFDDDEGDDLVPPIRGGPVPTPHASRSDLDPFDDYHRRSSTYIASFDDLLSPPEASYSDGGSFARSQRSGQSGEISDAEEGTIHHARLVSSTSPAVLSSVESVYVPIKRSESFFKRMAQGGITSLLSRQQSQKGTVRVLDVRDPTPAPELWPIESRDERSPSGPSYPPVAFKGGLAPISAHSKGPSLSSIQSAKSMRDMVIVQREPTASTVSEEEGVIGSATPELPDHVDTAPGDTRHGLTAASDSLSTIYAHGRHGQTALSDSLPSVASPDLSSDTAESVVFNGADFAPTPDLSFIAVPMAPTSTVSPDSTPRKASASTPIKLKPVPQSTPPRPPSPSTSLTTPSRPAAPPSGSPVPSPLVSHRRPVKDFVNSINKRGGGLPPAFASPASVYSPATTAPPSPLSRRDTERQGDRKRPMTMYEAVKRERLLVANPDKRKEMNRTNSS